MQPQRGGGRGTIQEEGYEEPVKPYDDETHLPRESDSAAFVRRNKKNDTSVNNAVLWESHRRSEVPNSHTHHQNLTNPETATAADKSRTSATVLVTKYRGGSNNNNKNNTKNNKEGADYHYSTDDDGADRRRSPFLPVLLEEHYQALQRRDDPNQESFSACLLLKDEIIDCQNGSPIIILPCPCENSSLCSIRNRRSLQFRF
jgi:hypothetical protein